MFHHPTPKTGGLQVTGRKNRYCVLTGDCIKYFGSLGTDGHPYDLKGAIELNKQTEVEAKGNRLLIVRRVLGRGACCDFRRFTSAFLSPQHNKTRTWDLEASSAEKADRWRERILTVISTSTATAAVTAPSPAS